jgi:GYF domain 2
MSELNWFYWSRRDQVGPFSRKQLISLYLKGSVSGATLVSQDSTYWLPLEKALQIPQVPVAPVHRDEGPSESHWSRHLGSTVCLILGTVFFVAGLAHLITGMGTEGALVSGPFMVLGAIAYRSAKKRRLDEAAPTVARRFVEVGLLLLICALVLTQNDLRYQITTHPVPNLIVPLWAIVAYSAVNLIHIPKGSLSNRWIRTRVRWWPYKNGNHTS